MFTQMSVHAFDMLGLVHVSLEVRQQEHDHEGPQLALHAVTDIQGEGEDDAREWAKAALVAMLEEL